MLHKIRLVAKPLRNIASKSLTRRKSEGAQRTRRRGGGVGARPSRATCQYIKWHYRLRNWRKVTRSRKRPPARPARAARPDLVTKTTLRRFAGEIRCGRLFFILFRRIPIAVKINGC
ncbi:hypothetical protein EVAR_102197_1 [Eumeta japonica]|uniref:Uncharacterized protein n=1 Tax=Eumeta variegata TaxID=151549 RepID=A0A4C1WGH8_EUMVA|nr:hypothetical protein EVAR_102197_1 [Eumeta japonica]